MYQLLQAPLILGQAAPVVLRCQRWNTGAAKRALLCSTSAWSKRITRSESSSPQPEYDSSRPLTSSRSARHAERLQVFTPSHAARCACESRRRAIAPAASRRFDFAATRARTHSADDHSCSGRCSASTRCGKLRRQQHAIAGEKPAGLGETAMLMHERARRNAIAVGEDDVVGVGARQRVVANRRGAKAVVLLPHVRDRERRARVRSARRQRRSRRSSRRPRRSARNRDPTAPCSPRSTACSASGRLYVVTMTASFISIGWIPVRSAGEQHELHVLVVRAFGVGHREHEAFAPVEETRRAAGRCARTSRAHAPPRWRSRPSVPCSCSVCAPQVE